MDLRSGNYFSIEKSGAILWEILAKTGDVDALLKKSEELVDPEKLNQIQTDIKNFVNKLMEEGLIVEAESQDKSEITEQMLNSYKKVVTATDTLEVNKYSDMQEMLLLDPIHDVDDQGWPEPKKENDKENE